MLLSCKCFLPFSKKIQIVMTKLNYQYPLASIKYKNIVPLAMFVVVIVVGCLPDLDAQKSGLVHTFDKIARPKIHKYYE